MGIFVMFLGRNERGIDTYRNCSTRRFLRSFDCKWNLLLNFRDDMKKKRKAVKKLKKSQIKKDYISLSGFSNVNPIFEHLKSNDVIGCKIVFDAKALRDLIRLVAREEADHAINRRIK